MEDGDLRKSATIEQQVTQKRKCLCQGDGREEGLEAELRILVDQVLRAKDLDRLQETTRRNFPNGSYSV